MSISNIQSALEARSMWQHFVEQYTSRGLTNLRDKLVAIAGVAELIQPLIGSEYVAGLWKRELVPDLIWMARSSPHDDLPFSDYTAPSFSWASIGGAVMPCRGRIIEECQLLDAQVSLSGSSPFGQVSGGWIRLRGYLLTTTFIAGEFFLSDENWVRRAMFDGGMEEFTFMNHDGQLEKGNGRMRSGSKPRDRTCPISLSLFYVGFLETDGEKSIQFFLLLGLSPRDPTCYERVGILALDRKDDCGSPFNHEWPLRFDEWSLTTITIV
ncbi:Uu.00g053680.m01.CDS01 [Anthostomella pinea]|uniref:Uu.00g053680.m01.CDS01 n=1 Tax=Anthostomella pinea TaxID=933095 RepID=A0AAI8VWJ0_9PEZI|nr:Uu.00g053680.m01.CDS01 [Anthostomella pinea]